MERTDEPTRLVTLPTGLEIAFYKEGGYFARGNAELGVEAGPLPRVTDILNILNKPALPWWGQGVGVQGVLDLWSKGLLQRTVDGKLAIVHPVENVWTLANLELVTDQLRLQKLTTNDVKTAAGDRGQATHDALEAWAVAGTIPSAENYPPTEQPYIRALRSFIEDVGGAWKTDGCEVVVASPAHRFAGRYDLRGTFTEQVNLVTQALRKDGSRPLKQPRHSVIAAGTSVLADLKTSKGIYPSHLLQLAAYEGASRECGYPPTDLRMVLHCTSHGVYEVRRTATAYEHFLAVLHLYEVMKLIEEAT